jgi:hypothetical protein
VVFSVKESSSPPPGDRALVEVAADETVYVVDGCVPPRPFSIRDRSGSRNNDHDQDCSPRSGTGAASRWSRGVCLLHWTSIGERSGAISF